MPKKGFITASAFNSCMTKSFGLTIQKYCCRVACERIEVDYLAEQFDISGLKAIEWGNENEGLAVAVYEASTFSTVHSRGKFARVDGLLVGGTCDGLVGTDGMIEVKCPNSDNHLRNLAYSAQLGDYIHQIQAYLWIYDRKWCDFISFDPRFPEDLRLHVKRVDRDEDIIEAIRVRASEMEDAISEMVERVRPGFMFKPDLD